MSEIADVTDMIAGFQEHNSCWLMVVVTMEETPKHRTLVLGMTAYDAPIVSLGAKPLASVSVKCSAMNLKKWNSALTHAMYALDFQLALKELGHAEPKKQ
jgi:hypothetical protein